MKKNYIYVLLYHIVIVVTPLFTTPYVSRVLGATNIGIDAYVNSVVQIFLVFILLNVGVYGRKKIAEAENINQLKNTFSGIYLMQLVCGFVVTVAYILFVLTTNSHQIIFLIYGFMLLAYMVDISWFFIGREKVKQIMMRNIIVRFISIVCIFLFVIDSGDLWIYVLINGLALLIGQLVTWGALFANIGKIYFSFRAMKPHIKSMLLLSIIPCISLLYTTVNKVILGIVVGTTEVGYYNQAFKLYIISMGFVSALSTVIMPRMAMYYKKGNNAKFRQFVNFSIRYVSISTIPLSFGLIGISVTFVPLFLGEAFTQVTPNLMLFAPCLFLAGIGDVLGLQILLITNQNRKYTLSIVIGSILSFGINLLIVGYGRSEGTVFSFLMANLIIVTLQLYFARDYYEFRYFFKIVCKYTIFSAIMLVAMLIAQVTLSGQGDLMTVIYQLMIGVYVYLLCLFLSKDPLLFQLLYRKVGF
ncbi:oligosaccharide flippase family protein [Listeria welshimeri]|uniref:oligosaccharide flippase family protein n=1 Tax=Listeria welshimeri TaxID=1643 RepID=UPI0016259B0B|nr:oligosaccharide flippase family protein [Listeria welshimeri]MBC1954178.1 oligosaccharide flippase family protein [Listeria welshimeri]MBC2091184.1 oligosaccharide flippase family protein [Listeria welshimeri]MBS9349869.1 oligosaccharide flippase family protein [Listeria welshimeri]